MIDVAEFQRLPGEDAWVRRSDPEIVIAGTADAPLAGRVEIADGVLSDVDRLVVTGAAYLESFVDRKRFAPTGHWHLECIEFGRSGDEPLHEFVVCFSLEEDVYGLWSVTFHYDARFGHVSGVGFARRQR